jgi:hypothetical protein
VKFPELSTVRVAICPLSVIIVQVWTPAPPPPPKTPRRWSAPAVNPIAIKTARIPAIFLGLK